MRHRVFAALAVALFAPGIASAQSLFGTHGLGIPVDGVDARARALGVNGVGLFGLSTSLLNPAEPAGTIRRGLTVSMQPWGGSAKLNGESDNIGGTRFPLFQVLYPIGRTTVTLGYAGLLDQSWAIVADGKELLGGDSVATRDVVRSTGGIGELKLGAARYLTPRLSVGAAVGVHTGNVERSVTRTFPDSGSTLRGFQSASRWDYSGPLAAVGVRWDPTRSMRVGGSVTWSGTLNAKPQQGSTTAYKYDLPLRFAAGVSGSVSRDLLFAVSTTLGTYGSGSYTAPGTSVNTVADKSLDVGGGLEWQSLRSGTRIFPLRAGFRYSKLPFHNANEAAAKEWSASGGIGLRLVEDDFGPLAVADLGVERGKRDGFSSPTSAGGLSETFWRLTATISLFGR